MGGQLFDRVRRAVRRDVGRRCADDQLQREQAPGGDAVLRGRPDPEAHVRAVAHPVADAVVELHVGLDVGMSPTELVDQGPEHGQERVLRGDDAQRAGDIVLGRADAIDGALEGRQRGLRGLEKLLPLGRERDAACRPVQQAHAQPMFEGGERLAGGLRADALGRRRAPDAAELDGLREGFDGAKFADGHPMLPEEMNRQYQPGLANRSSRRRLVD